MADRLKILVKVGQPPTEEIWELCEHNYSYCPTHGKCPDILDFARGGSEWTKKFIIEPMFFCKKCGMVKMINVWNNCSGLTEGRLVNYEAGQKRLS